MRVDLVLGAALLVLIACGVALFLRRVEDARPVKVTQEQLIEHPPAEVARLVVEALLDLPGAHLEEISPYRSLLVTSRAPTWTVLAAVWLPPLGLALALVLRQRVTLEVSMFATRAGTVVRLSGQTEAALLRRAGAAVASVHGARASSRLVEA